MRLRWLWFLLALFIIGCTASSTTVTVPTPAQRAALVPPRLTATPTVASIPPTHTPAATPTTPPTATPAPTEPPCTDAGRIETGTFSSTIAGEPQRYRIFLPPCYGNSGREYPAVYLFHGNIHDDSFWDTLGADEVAGAAMLAGELSPYVIVMPDGGYLANYSSGGPFSFEGVVLTDLIPYIERAYCVWDEPAGRAIGGVSRGGYWALEIAFRHADSFISVGGHSVALLDTAAGPDLNPQFTGITNPLGNLRIYFDVGENDFVRTNIERLHNDMVSIGIAHEWQLNLGGHDETYWQTHLPAYLDWYGAPWPSADSAYARCTR